ncbi:hypothetical protein LTR10_015039 [Elasticomyces elasticus]|uniref:F-box domain-containing protein n=1 Tax=Exophiala sideris TaxID=1016849 RepID=A0ABR0JS77_9EURO|nr:hypothetical protein LTR10_015039 [Elasticomyces elasticus]KAK5034765.1 hypothetical protein LTR13_006422 [Exophiala sideris]KAK5039915.1 hypothetical protein LTS07_000410 [Exophiala sideris]KAK5068294.1 hypothetical protein LTR69_000412 [Exophiala sideris]KAK5187595.1 hypothetical protein LTR44_000411 [Eurotiomycetes sp. CCFEE 6388]
MLDSLPQETLGQVILNLGPPDLKHLRLVNRTLEHKVVPALFRKVSVSLLTVNNLRDIAQDSEISNYVEELWYREMDFSGIATVPGTDQYDDIQNLKDTIAQYIALSKNLRLTPQMTLCPPREPLHQRPLAGFGIEDEEAEGTTKDYDEGNRILNQFERDIPHVIGSYNRKAALQRSGYLHQAFAFAFKRLPNLRRIVSAEPVDGVATGYLALEDDVRLRWLHEDIFPVTDAALHTIFRPWQVAWPGHGFIGIWQALNEPRLHPNIHHLEIKRDEDLFLKRGIPISWMDSGLGGKATGGAFSYLRSLKLCLEVPLAVHPWSQNFVAALANAQYLRELEISLTSSHGHGHPGMRLTDILPMTTLPNLHSVTLEDFQFSMQEISEWLFKQPKLRNLSLKRPVLNGYWAMLVELWSARTQFVLESFILKDPFDYEVQEERDDPAGCRVPARIPENALVQYINYGGVNPVQHRRWRRFDEPMNSDDDIDHELSDFSDMSEWLSDDHPDPVEDPDGPEFDEDYDFDAEDDSDVDMDVAWREADEDDNDDSGEDVDAEMVDSD